MYQAKMILDSINDSGNRLRTMTLTYPRIVHSEFMTHRMFARNAASSRAIPFSKMTAAVMDDPFIPIEWGTEQRGMQGGPPLPDGALKDEAIRAWLQARDAAVELATSIHHIGTDGGKIHKSIPNRLLEPWAWITVVVTATEWNNFFRLRCHPAAEPHIRKIAEMALDVMDQSTPTERRKHIPFVDVEDMDDMFVWSKELDQPVGEIMERCSVARCARVSYLTHEGERSIAKDLELYNKLVDGSGSGHPHASPFEHVATAEEGRHGAFFGWKPRRVTLVNENVPG